MSKKMGRFRSGFARSVVEIDGQEKLYFVVETKGKESLLLNILRPTEQAKIDCGREHFKALDNEIEFTVADSYEKFIEQVLR